jgi:hypothetical protein
MLIFCDMQAGRASGGLPAVTLQVCGKSTHAIEALGGEEV